MILTGPFEDWIVGKIQTANAAITSTRAFVTIDKIGKFEIDEDNLGEFTRILPACLLGLVSDSVTEDLDALGTVQMVEHELIVNICTQGVFRRGIASDNSQVLENAVKSALRGLTYNITDGGAEKTWLRYRGTTTVRLDGGILIRPQRYVLTVQECED